MKKIALILATVILSSCTTTVRYANNTHYSEAKPKVQTSKGKTLFGKASYYAYKFHGRTTANGERFDMHDFTAAHKELPFDTIVKVTNLKNGKTVVVRINDRGPFVKGRVIDLSKGAAEEIDMIAAGVVDVKLEIMN